jgi:tetratricopeptide (TPR) repeat protein
MKINLKRYSRYFFIPLFLLWSPAIEDLVAKADLRLAQGNIKDAETLYKNFLSTNPGKKEVILAKVKLATVYFNDQEEVKAFKIFLEALNDTDIQIKNLPKETENYREALKIYLSEGGHNLKDNAKIIIDHYQDKIALDDFDSNLGYLLAASYANNGQYNLFFDLFYKSYELNPSQFLSFKSKAILNIKLFERAESDEQRAVYRNEIISNVNSAINQEPNDTSLYRMSLAFTPDDKKPELLSLYLNKIIDSNIVINRRDIPYYVEMCIAFDQVDLARKFVNKAKEWYSFSRVICAAEERLKS